jgi:hypothetical protein
MISSPIAAPSDGLRAGRPGHAKWQRSALQTLANGTGSVVLGQLSPANSRSAKRAVPCHRAPGMSTRDQSLADSPIEMDWPGSCGGMERTLLAFCREIRTRPLPNLSHMRCGLFTKEFKA